VSDAAGRWARATLALRILAVDPEGLGGLWLRARCGPARDRLATLLPALPLPLRRIHPGIGDEALFGGLDLGATLAAGHTVRSAGLLDTPGALVLPMAERCTPGLAARLATALDELRGHCLVALDEGAEPDERLPVALIDRLALHVDLEGLALAECHPPEPDPARLAAARALLPDVRIAPQAAEALTALAARLGIESMRAPQLALRAARASAALDGRRETTVADLELAAALVLAGRATRLPAEEEETPPDTEAPDDPPTPENREDDAPDDENGPGENELRIPEEMLLEAVRANLPPDLLERLAAGAGQRGAQGLAGSGARVKGNRRGRPLPSRAGRLGSSARVDLVGTLRAAAPWQPLRRSLAQHDALVHIRPSDIRTRRYEERSDRLLVFTVDASGSAALARLAEAKGAVELLLAEAYARRDHVALVAFKGTDAQLLLPPTRSLVQTKRRLAELPGGGGTPLAAGLQAALGVALAARARGMTPTVALLTDGRPNIALDGRADRAAAAEDSTALARALRANGVAALVVDVSNRPQAALGTLAAEMAAPYIPLPRADSRRLSAAVSAALETG